MLIANTNATMDGKENNQIRKLFFFFKVRIGIVYFDILKVVVLARF